MAIFVAVQFALRTRRASVTAFLVVVLMEATNEILDRLFCGSWRLRDTTGDIVATLFWPAAIVLLSKYRRARWQGDLNREKETRRSLLRSIVRPHVGLAQTNTFVS
jgi:hypothetical protein